MNFPSRESQLQKGILREKQTGKERPDHQVVLQAQVRVPTIDPLVHDEEHPSFYQKQAESGPRQQFPKS